MSFSSVAEVLEGLVALAVYYQAFRFYRLSGERALMRVSASFLALGVGLLAHGLSLGAVLLALAGPVRALTRPALFISRVMALALFGCEAFAYGYLAYFYAKPSQEEAAEGLLFPLVLRETPEKPPRPEALIRFIRYHPLLECVVLALLVYLTYKTVSNFLSSRDANPFLIGFAFLFLTAAHACFMLSYFLATFYFTAHVLQLLAFVCVFIVLLRVVSA